MVGISFVRPSARAFPAHIAIDVVGALDLLGSERGCVLIAISGTAQAHGLKCVFTGTRLFAKSPVPSSPLPFSPQQYTSPLDTIPQEEPFPD